MAEDLHRLGKYIVDFLNSPQFGAQRVSLHFEWLEEEKKIKEYVNGQEERTLTVKEMAEELQPVANQFPNQAQ